MCNIYFNQYIWYQNQFFLPQYLPGNRRFFSLLKLRWITGTTHEYSVCIPCAISIANYLHNFSIIWNFISNSWRYLFNVPMVDDFIIMPWESNNNKYRYIYIYMIIIIIINIIIIQEDILRLFTYIRFCYTGYVPRW